MRLRIAISILLLFTVAAGAAQAAAAPKAPSFALRPLKYDPALPETKSYFVLDTSAGAVIADRIRVTNVGNLTGTVKLYPVDATTGQTSGTVYKNASAPRRDAGSWIALAQSTLTLAPHESRVVSFRVTVPAGASPGDHVAGIVADNQTLTQRPDGGAIRIKIKHLTVSAVVVRVAGPASAGLSVGRATATGGHGFQYLHIALANTGGVMIKPAGMLLIERGGKTVLRKPLTLDTLIPHTSIAYPVSLPAALKPGDYTASVSLRYGNRVLEDGDGVGGSLAESHTLPFHVSSGEYKQIYRGTPALTRGSTSSSGTSMPLLVSWVVAGLAVLALLAVVLMRRRVVVR
jgi:Bacterial protein of unknown function (DUF916)